MSELARIEHSVHDIELIAKKVAASRLFPGIDTEQQAFSLMLLCQSEGLHPMQAIRRYHIVKGRPAMRADAIQAEFQRQGGLIRDIHADKKGASARFIHPIHAPEPGIEIKFSEADAKQAGVFSSNPNYQKWPDAMYWARVVSIGVRRVLPGVVVGIYTPEEVQDFDEPKTIEARVRELPKRESKAAIEAARYDGPKTVAEFAAFLKEIDPERKPGGPIAHMQAWGESKGYGSKIGNWTDIIARLGYAEMCRKLAEPKPEDESQDMADADVIDVEADDDEWIDTTAIATEAATTAH